MKAINTLKNHILDLEKMVLVFDEYAMYKSRDESKKAIQELTQVIAELEDLGREKIINEEKYKSGFYLVLEGVDFAGKSTVAKELVSRLQNIYGADIVIHKREPSNTNYGKKMRNTLLSKEMTLEKEVLAAQYMLLDRVENTSNVSQLLRENKIIVQERNFLTALVYNEAKDTKEVQFVQEANRLSLKPDCLTLLTISDEMLLYRLEKAKEERDSLDSYETYEKVIKRKRDYLSFDEYIDVLLPNDNKECFEVSMNTLIKIVAENFKIVSGNCE